MLTNYFKIAWRNLKSNKTTSLINIGGLAVGMAVALLIGLWVFDELSFNTHHQDYQRIGQVKKHNGTDLNGTYSSLPMPVADELRRSFGDDFRRVALSSGTESHILTVGENKFSETGRFMEPKGPEIFSLEMVSGIRIGLRNPNTILISESLSKKLFGISDAPERTIKLNNQSILKVVGVYKDMPANSTFGETNFIASWDVYSSTNDWMKDAKHDWTNNSFSVFVELAPKADFEHASARIKDLEMKFISKERQQNKPELFVHPMSRWHLYSYFENRQNATSEQLKIVWFYSIIGIFVLLLACINFMNLSTARSEKRAREVGIRKAVGSSKNQLVGQFYCESILTVVFAFIGSLAITQILLPWFNQVAGKSVTIPFTSGTFWLSAVVLIMFTGLLAGSYPALYLSSFQPVKVLKGVIRFGTYAALPRKVLVVFQFTVSICLIVGTIVVIRQIQFAMDRPVGYAQDRLIQIQMATSEFKDNYEIIRNELKASGYIANVATASGPVTQSFSNTGGLIWKGKDDDFEDDFAVVRVSHDYASTIGLKFLDGRNFSLDYASDSTGIILNQTAVKYMGLNNPVGQTIEWRSPQWNDEPRKFRVLGVVQDIVMNSPFEPVKQTLFVLGKNPPWISVQINPDADITSALSAVESIFKRSTPSVPFTYRFAKDAYDQKFAPEKRIGILARFFAVLTILISCLGLFGLASFVAEQRTKEIGIRKVLGATVAGLWQMLSKDFLKLILIACAISIPLSGLFMDAWLSKYQYRSDVSWWIFVATGAGALLITLITVSFQAIKVAIMSPVKSLRSGNS